MDSNTVLIGFDFSINKPAMTVYYNKQYYHYFWPIKKIPKKNLKAYNDANVTVYCRNLESVTKNNFESSLLVLTHTIRSVELCNKIINDLDNLLFNIIKLNTETYKLYVCSEGLSFASKGDATLNLATYKGVLLAKIYEHFGDHLLHLFTYPPIAIKSTAECADKESIKDKSKMIQKYILEDNNIPLRIALSEGKLKAKKNYVSGIDDIVDSYWALQTMVKKEGLIL